MRQWAATNADGLAAYLAAYIEGQRHVLNPAHRAEMIALLAARFSLTPSVAEGTYEAVVASGSGLAPDAAFNNEGFATVLSIRAEMEGMWGGKAPQGHRYLDLSHYGQALGLANVRAC